MTDDSSTLVGRLRSVIDPELGVSIVDLGLVYACGMEGSVATVLLTTTTPACPIGSYLEQAIRWALCDLPGVTDVEVELTHEPPWTTARMSPAARLALGMPV
jgi:metal-sulfur cluster biosynthetic enzyme